MSLKVKVSPAQGWPGAAVPVSIFVEVAPNIGFKVTVHVPAPPGSGTSLQVSGSISAKPAMKVGTFLFGILVPATFGDTGFGDKRRIATLPGIVPILAAGRVWPAALSEYIMAATKATAARKQCMEVTSPRFETSDWRSTSDYWVTPKL
jgi:hypothetical protein